MGDLSFTLSVKSSLDKQMRTFSESIKKTEKEVDELNSKLNKATLNNRNDEAAKYKQQLADANKSIKDQVSSYKQLETRMQQILDRAHDLDNIYKKLRSNGRSLEMFNPGAVKTIRDEMAQLIRQVRSLYAAGEGSPFATGAGFKSGLGDLKRGISDVKKELTGAASTANKSATQATRQAEKAIADFEKAEAKAAEYYVTRKQRVDDAIQSLSQRQARFAELARNSSMEDARMLKSMGDQAEVIKQRLLAAKTQYEQLQQLKAQGVPGAALSSTFLGRSTGMAELFGGQYGMAYNDFIAKSKEAVTLAQQHNAELEKRLKIEERIAQRRAEINAQRKVSVKNTIFDTAPIERQIEKYEKAVAVYRELQKVLSDIGAAKSLGARRNDSIIGADYGKLQQQAEMLKATFENLGNGFGIEKIQQELNSLYATLERFTTANANAKPLINEVHDPWNIERQRLQRQAEHQRRQQEIEDAFRAQAAERKNAQANVETARRAQEAIKKLQNERRDNQLKNLEQIEAKEREVAQLYSRLRSVRDTGKANGADVSAIERDLQMVRQLYAELQALRRNVPSGKGFSPIGFSSSEMAKMKSDAQAVKTEVAGIQNEARGATQAARDLASAFDRVHNSASKSSQVLSDIKSLFLQGGIVFAAQQFANSIIKTGGDIAQQHIALRSILGDIQKADTLFAQTQQLALQSPFTFQELNRDVKQLAAFGVDTDRLYDTTKRLADVASGLGVSFERLGLAYGQVKARSWLDGKELRQFAYAGLPMLQKIADLYNETGKNGRRDYTTSDVRTMITKRQVSFEDVDKVFQRLTDAGGQFYNMQFVLSETLLGRWNKLQDAWTIMLGKFADGENIIGRVFSTAINGATQLVLSLDRISPLLLSVGAMFAGKKLFGAAMTYMGFGVTSMTKQMALVQAQQLKTYANTQLQKVAEGEITAQLAQQNILRRQQILNSAAVKDLSYAQLLSEGKLSVFQIGLLARKKQISAEMIAQLRTMGLLNAEQARLIMLAAQEGNTRKGNLAIMQLGAQGAAGKLGGLLTGGNLAMIGASVGLALWMGYSQWSARIEQASKAALEHIKQQAKQLQSEIANARQSGVSEASVKNMQEMVESSDLYTRSMQEQVEHASTLKEKYDALLDVMQQMQKVSENMQRYSGETESGMKATSLGVGYDKGSWWKNLLYYGFVPGQAAKLGYNFLLNDDLSKNFEQYTSQRTQYDNSVSEMQKYADQIHSVMDGIRKDYADTYEAIQGKPFEQQLRILSNSDAWETIVGNISENDKAFKGLAKTYISNTEDVDSAWSEIVNDDIPRFMSQLAYNRNMDLEGFKEYCKKNPQYTAAMIRNVVSNLNEGSAQTKRHLVDVLIEFFGLAKGEADAIRKEATETEYDKQTNVGKQLLSSVVNRYGNGVATVVDINKVAGKGDDYAKAKQNIQSQYNSANENYLAAKGAGASGSSLAALKAERDKWEKVALANGITVSSKSDKANDAARRKAEAERRRAEQAARKADQADEKRLKARLQLIKEAYDTYQKYYKVLQNEEEAAKRVSEQYKGRGLSNDDVSKIRSESGYRQLMEDYVRMARNINYRQPEEMKERKDEDIAAGVKELNDLDLNILTRELDEFASQVNLDLDRMSRTYESYRSVLKATGSAEIAARLSGLGGDANGRDYSVYNNGGNRTGYVSFYSDYLKNYLDNMVLSSSNPDRAIDYKALMGMSDKDIEKYAGELFAANDPQKIKGVTDAMKKLRDLVTDTEFRQGMEAFDALMEQIVTQAARQARNKSSYDETMNRLESLRTQGKITQAGYDQASAVAKANFDAQNLQAEDAYKQFMGQVTSMTQSAAEQMRDKILDNLDEKLAAGTITADEYTKSLEQVAQQMAAFSNRHSNTFNFLTGGLNSLASGMMQNALDKIRKDMANVQSGGKGGKYFAVNKDTGKGELTGLGQALLGKAGGFASSVGMVDMIVNGINTNVQSYKNLENTWTDAFGDGLKNSKFSNFMSGFTEASQGAADAWNSLKSGDFVGMIDGGIRSFTGWFSFSNAAANKRWQKQAEYLKGFQGTLKEINNNLKNKVSSSYGSMSSLYGSELQRNLRSEASEVRKTYRDWSQAHTIHRNHRNRVYTNLNYDEINAYLRSIGYRGSAVGGDTIQNLSGEMLEKVRERFAGQWSQLPDEAKEYLNRLIEIEGETGEIVDATEQLKEALTDLNVDTLQSEYESLLDDLDSDNESFADNLEQHLRKAILNTMLANLYKDQIQELVDYAANMADTKSGQYVSKSGAIKTHTGSGADADVLSEYTQAEYESIMEREKALADSMLNQREYLENLYGWSNGSSASMSSSIKGITETTADLLASYLNAMRADVSVIRQQEALYLPRLDITATAQLQQLGQITQNTLRNAEAAERIEVAVSNLNDMFGKSFSGAKQLSVRVN